MRSVTKQAVREARLKEIKQELLNSEKLKVSGLLSLLLPFLFRFLFHGTDWSVVLSLRHTLRTTPETCSC